MALVTRDYLLMSLRAFVSMSVFNTPKVERFDPAVPQVYCRSMPPLACLAATFSSSPTLFAISKRMIGSSLAAVLIRKQKQLDKEVDLIYKVSTPDR
jgi:hypothetical protein